MGFLNIPQDMQHAEASSSSFDLVPKGWFNAVIEHIEIKQSQSSAAEFMAVTYVITGPTHANRKIWSNIMFSPDPGKSTYQKVLGMAKGQLTALFGAFGYDYQSTDPMQLINQQVGIKVGISKGTGDWPDKNQVDSFRPVSGGTAQPPAQQPMQQQPAQQAAPQQPAQNGQPSWSR